MADPDHVQAGRDISETVEGATTAAHESYPVSGALPLPHPRCATEAPPSRQGKRGLWPIAKERWQVLLQAVSLDTVLARASILCRVVKSPAKVVKNPKQLEQSNVYVQYPVRFWLKPAFCRSQGPHEEQAVLW